MEKEDIMIELLKEISGRLSAVEQRQISDKQELLSIIRTDKQEILNVIRTDKQELFSIIKTDKNEILERMTSFEQNIQYQLSDIKTDIRYEKQRMNEVYEARKEVTVNWSAKMMGINGIFAGIIALIVSSFK